MTPLELKKWAKQNESTNTNAFPKVAHGFCAIGISLIIIGITLLQRNNNDNNT